MALWVDCVLLPDVLPFGLLEFVQQVVKVGSYLGRQKGRQPYGSSGGDYADAWNFRETRYVDGSVG